MQSQDKIVKSYNDTAPKYAANRADEFYKKHFDLFLLKEFAFENKDNGRCADFGCGPGHTTKFLYDHGIQDVIGIDISSGMIETAQRLFPEIKFQTGDLLNLSNEPNYFSSAIAFYAIVHFTYDQVKNAFNEINSVLKRGGQFLFSFHVGDEVVHFDKVNDVHVDIDLYYFQTDKIIKLLHDTGFTTIDVLERHPYKNVEYVSRRAYIWAEKN